MSWHEATVQKQVSFLGHGNISYSWGETVLLPNRLWSAVVQFRGFYRDSVDVWVLLSNLQLRNRELLVFYISIHFFNTGFASLPHALFTLASWACCISSTLCALANWSIFSKAFNLPRKDFWEGSSGLFSGGSRFLIGLSIRPLVARGTKLGFSAMGGGRGLLMLGEFWIWWCSKLAGLLAFGSCGWLKCPCAASPWSSGFTWEKNAPCITVCKALAKSHGPFFWDKIRTFSH